MFSSSGPKSAPKDIGKLHKDDIMTVKFVKIVWKNFRKVFFFREGFGNYRKYFVKRFIFNFFQCAGGDGDNSGCFKLFILMMVLTSMLPSC